VFKLLDAPDQAAPVAERHPWWQQGVVYQIYPRSFRDASGDGTGDLAGVLQQLDYLSDTLGVDALWLSPFYPSPMADFGYDIADHTDVDRLFGDLATFDELVAQAHARGLKVIIDYVPNHTSDQHPWFQAARSSRDNPYRDWYLWADPKPDGSPPNTWLSVFGGSAWEWDAATGQFYLHSFLKEQPDLNWRNPCLTSTMFQVLRFWLERGVDGVRIDAAHFILKDPELRDNPPNQHAAASLHKPMGEYDAQLHLYDKAHPDVHTVFRELRQVLESYSTPGHERVAIGEIHVFDWAEWSRYYGEALDELHLPFNFGLLGAAWEADTVRRVVDGLEAILPEGAWPNYVLGNHDEPRVASRLGRQQARLAMLLLLTVRGTPTLYYGDELGMQDVPIPPAAVQDPWEHRMPGRGLGRDPERTPMQWHRGPNAGFCPPDVAPWLPVAADAERINVAAQLNDPRSFLTLTRQLLALRRSRSALASGTYRALDDDGVPHDCFVYLRRAGAQCLLVALNFSADTRVLHLRAPARGSVLVSTHLDRLGPADLAAFRLRPAEGCVLELDQAASDLDAG
jgi:alpha-glucosidase